MKLFSTLLGMLITGMLFGQNSTDLIPSNAKIVLTFKGEEVLQNTSQEQLESYEVFRKTITSFVGDYNVINKYDVTRPPLENLEEVGISTKGNVHFFYLGGDTVNISGMSCDLSNSKTLEEHFANQDFVISTYKKLKYVIITGFYGHKLVFWNKKAALFLDASLEWDMKYQLDELERYNDTEVTEEAVEEIYEEEYQEEVIEEEAYVEEVYEEEAYYYGNDSYNYDLKDWVDAQVALAGGDKAPLDAIIWNSSTSIINTSFFDKSKNLTQEFYDNFNKKHIMSFYMDQQALLEMDRDISYWTNSFSTQGQSSYFVGGIEVGVDKLSIQMETTQEDSLADIQRKVIGDGMSQDLLKYLVANPLAIATYSIDTEELLNALPESVNLAVKQLDPMLYRELGMPNAENIPVVAELLAVILDEKAIGEMLSGDLIIALNNLEMIETTFTNYKYDPNTFESIEFEDSTTSTIPNLSILMGSKDAEKIGLLAKLIALNVPTETLGSGLQMIAIPGMDFNVYYFYNDEVFYIGTNEESTLNAYNKSSEGLNQELSNLSIQNYGFMYVDINSLLEFYFESKANNEDMPSEMKTFEPSMVISQKLEGNKIISSMSYNTKGSGENALTRLLTLFEKLYEREIKKI